MSLFDELFMPQSLEGETEIMPIFNLDDDDMEKQKPIPNVLPILALKNTVLFPSVIIPITVGRKKSLEAIQEAYKSNQYIGVLSQQDTKVEDPSDEDLYAIGTVARIIKLLRMPDGTTTAILRGAKRFQLRKLLKSSPYLEGEVNVIDELPITDNGEFVAMIESIKDLAQKIIKLSPNIPGEANMVLKNMEKHDFLINLIASNLGVKVYLKQELLEINDWNEKAEAVLIHMSRELEVLKLRDKIESKVRVDLEKQQRDYLLNQQLKTIQEELGGNPEVKELDALELRAKKKKWGEDVAKVFARSLKKVRRINPSVAEYSVLMTYLELMLDLPWGEYTKDNFNLKKAQQILDKDHCGLDKVKDRILEHLAVLKLKGDLKAPILCLVGPPGVGKTSLGRSIARALNRKYIRMSLGGLHDESEIRGHRKTYIGAMPGRVIQSLKKAKSANPVFILDEIDKVGKDFRGDPSSALLEVLDPEQNSTFHDNYLDVEFDLSKVLFIATANSLNTIQPALRDRMEIIYVSGYSLEEKVEIAKQHLIPKQRKEHGLKGKDIRLSDKTISPIIKHYTRESGVRELDRRLAAVMRNTAKKVAMEEKYSPTIKPTELRDILGPKRYSSELYQANNMAGVVVGLSWTRFGGAILFIEASLSKGKGKLTLTGNLGNVMKESATTALSYIKTHAESIGISHELFEEKDIHIHVPEGAIPKDGPSAGIAMITVLVSTFLNRPIKPYLAMTGEITLRGKVLPVGGIKEKMLAAKRAGIKEIILCKENEKNIEEVEQSYLKGLTFHYVEDMKDVLRLALDLKISAN